MTKEINSAMRRNEKEVTDRSAIDAIIRKSSVCRLGMIDGEEPYIVPLCFGYHENSLYFHCALEGRKIGILLRNPNVCFEFDSFIEIKEAENACDWGMKYRSVIGFGKAVFIEETGEKRKALGIIMGQYSDRSFQFPEKMLRATAVIKVDIERMSGKQSGF